MSLENPSSDLREVLRREKKVIALLGAVQFVNVLDFMMVMPLGPDLAQALAFTPSHLGWVGGAYTAAASVSGLISSLFLDRFDRKTALNWSLFGLALATLLGGMTSSFESLLFARVLAGIFGGPAAALTFSMAADATPPERRGRAMGAIMSSFSIASIFGVPAGLELARIGGWRLPFFAVGALAFIVLAVAMKWIPSMRGHIARALEDRPWDSTLSLLRKKEVWYAYLCLSLGMAAGFMVIPNIASYFQFNLGYPREKLGLLYLAGGSASFVLMLVSGRFVDRIGGATVGSIGTIALMLTIYFGYYPDPPKLPLILMFVGFMASMGVRGVASSALASRVPQAHERARFTSILSVFQHAASASGAFFSAYLLSQDESGRLVGMANVSLWSMGFAVFVMFFLFALERRLKRLPKPKVVHTEEILATELG
jgi:predicted MFS family arabinose efflux permease